jgi:hypothetical protein
MNAINHPGPTYRAKYIAPGVRYLYDPQGRIVAEIISEASAQAQDDASSYINEAEAAQAATLFQAAPGMLAALRGAAHSLAWHIEQQGRGVAMDAEILRRVRAQIAAVDGVAPGGAA